MWPEQIDAATRSPRPGTQPLCFIFLYCASAFTVAVLLDPDDLRVDLVEAHPAGILTGLYIVPMSVSGTTVYHIS